MQESVSKHVDSRVFSASLTGRSTALAPSLHLQTLPLVGDAWTQLISHRIGSVGVQGVLSWLLAIANTPNLPQGRQGGLCGVSLGYLGCRAGTSGAGPEPLDSTAAQKGLRTSWWSQPEPSTLRERCRRMRCPHGVCSLQPSLSGFPSGCNSAGYLGAFLLPFFHPDTYPCTSQPLELQPLRSQAGGRCLATLECSAVITSLPRNFWGQRT